jgi:Fe-S cluster biogenesis protein NfuA
MSAPQDISVELEFTPNPNTLKYVTNSAFLLAGAENFPEPKSAEGRSLLAQALFALNGISGIMIGRNFVTVTLADPDSLTELNEQIIETIRKFIASGEKAVIPSERAPSAASANSSDAERKIIEILDTDIRPAVAMDGGDITFERFENGVVYLHMKGSCSGCPSSTATLKMGIENRLRDAIPEIVEVVAI